MSGQADTPVRCRGCGRKLTAASSVAARRGRTCLGRYRAALAAAQTTITPAQHAKVLALIEDGKIRRQGPEGGYTAQASDGVTKYVVNAVTGFCCCPAGLRGRHCYHLAAALVLSASTSRLAA